MGFKTTCLEHPITLKAGRERIFLPVTSQFQRREILRFQYFENDGPVICEPENLSMSAAGYSFQWRITALPSDSHILFFPALCQPFLWSNYMCHCVRVRTVYKMRVFQQISLTKLFRVR